MKAAFYGLGIVFFGVLGLFLISLFGDITVTNQQDYSYLKKHVEAAMYDARDEISYKKGFCVCTNVSQINGVYNIDNKNDYVIQNLYDDKIECNSTDYSFCQKVVGEYKISEEVFVESFLRRFAENTKGNKNFQVIVKDVIEYPPKVSVEIRTYSNYNLFDTKEATFDENDFEISNKIDAIIEENNISGDVNDDGVVNTSDSLLLTKYLNGDAVTISENGLKNADMNLDGKLDMMDVEQIQKVISGWYN